MDDELIVIGHRGASIVAPENTMGAFRLALDLGADGIEFDVQLTADGHPVVLHDANLDRTTDGTGPLFDATLAQVRALDAGAWFDDEHAGARVPQLDEVLELDANVFELEIKGWGRALLDAVVERVDAAGVFDRVKFTGWDHAKLSRLKAERPDATVGLFSKRPEPWMSDRVYERYVLGTAETAGFDVAHVYAGVITEPIASGLRELGYAVHANDADSPEQIRRAIDAGATSISLDDVELAVAMKDR